jgi:glucose/arabinose dehydrogenase
MALLSRPNRPWILLIVGSVVALGAFLYLDGGDDTLTASDGAVSSSSSSTDAGTTTEESPPATQDTAPEASEATQPDSTTPSPAALGDLQGLALETVASDLTFPVFAASPPGDDRIFAVLRPGTIAILDPEEGVLEKRFLDIRDRIDSASGIEIGLLGLAFHPDYADNGRFFVYYTDLNNDSVLAEYSVTADPDLADPESEQVLLFIDQVGLRHRAGMLQFGPDGYLYVALGDGAQFDVTPQNLEMLQGSILRLDVDGGDPYSIPADNPFASGGGAPEIFLYGFRNPWRFSIDPVEGMIYVGDVGQETWEEIDVIGLSSGGGNFGWPLMEGSACFTDPDCSERTDLIRPAVEYSHDEGCSVTGGYVYRGAAIPELQGHYFYGDWCGQWVRSFRPVGGDAIDHQDWSETFGEIGQVASFGLDGAGELLIITSDNGRIYRLVAER